MCDGYGIAFRAMKDVRVDSSGDFRCWNCGGRNFLEKRTARSKVAVGVGALVTKKKLKCQTCGEYNDTGNAKPYSGPASRKWAKKERADVMGPTYKSPEAAMLAADPPAGPNPSRSPGESGPPPPGARPVQGVPPPPTAPAGWHADPVGRHEHRYFDGSAWTDQVADAGTPSLDPLQG